MCNIAYPSAEVFTLKAHQNGGGGGGTFYSACHCSRGGRKKLWRAKAFCGWDIYMALQSVEFMSGVKLVMCI